MFANGPGERGSIPGRVKPKTQKMLRDTASLNNLHYKVRIKGKVERPTLHLVVEAIEKRGFGSLATKIANFNFYLLTYIIRK